MLALFWRTVIRTAGVLGFSLQKENFLEVSDAEYVQKANTQKLHTQHLGKKKIMANSLKVQCTKSFAYSKKISQFKTVESLSSIVQ